jgi:hypothetical protein
MKEAFEKMTGMPDAWTNPALMVSRNAFIQGWEAALAQPAQQEPIGYAVPTFDFDNSVIKKVHYAGTVPLYTTPPQREWVGLDEKDFSAINQSCLTKLQAATSAESVLKEKNNG